MPRLFRPIEVAEQLLLEAREQIVAESHHPNLLDNLDAAEEIFVLNGRLDRLHRIAEYRPLAMLARGDHASAVANSLATYSNTSLPVTTRLRAGMTVLLALGTSDDRKAAASHILGYAQMADRLELDEAALCIHAALARCRISVVLAEAGLPTVSSSAIGPHPTRTFESVRRVADDLVQDLDQKARKLGTVELSDPMVPLTLAYLRCIATRSLDVGLVFAQARLACGLNHPTTALIFEGHAHLFRGDYDRAGTVLRAAVEQAKSGAVLHLQASAHFHLAQALARQGNTDKAWSHVVAYCDILHVKLSRFVLRMTSIVHQTSDRDAQREPSPALEPAVARKVQSEPPYLRRARRFIESNLRQDLSIEMIVDASGVSRRSLELAFRTFRDTGPIAYLRQTRLKRAHKLLTSTELSISKIREEVGYRNASMFSRDFRSHFGYPPLAARRNARLTSE